MNSSPILFGKRDAPYYEFSNFYPGSITEHGVTWPTVEHYFQAQKFISNDYKEKIRRANSPKEAKRLGHAKPIEIEGWEVVKERVMKRALMLKFQQPQFKKLLLNTGKRELIEGTPHDSYWGSGADGEGLNRLGQLLMEVREELGTDSKL